MPRRRTLVAVVLVSATTLATCRAGPPDGAAGNGPAPTTAAATEATATTSPTFNGEVTAVTAADLPSSWRAGCPVGPPDLRMLRMTYRGFDGASHRGAMVVHAAVAGEVLEVFRTLYERGFPIRRMEPVDAFGGSDEASIAADNTSGFNCRNAVASGPPTWSAHAYGRAIDVNPVENPYVLDGRVLPPAGAQYVDRSHVRPGMAVQGGDLNTAFAAIGWSWGGTWRSPDYQHFSETGN